MPARVLCLPGMLTRYALGFLSAAAIALVVFTVQPKPKGFPFFASIGNYSISTNISSPPSCKAVGDSCVSDAECCDEGNMGCNEVTRRCENLPYECYAEGERCDGFKWNCCDEDGAPSHDVGKCVYTTFVNNVGVSTGNGYVCHTPRSCNELGDPCAADDHCCSGKCSRIGGTTWESFGTCIPDNGASSSPPPSCLAYGESCVLNPGGCCQASSLACKIAGTQMLCLPGSCSMDGGVCMFDFECCSGACNDNQCGSSSSAESSNSSLPTEYCGDGTEQKYGPGPDGVTGNADDMEQCDDGNDDDTDACNSLCLDTYCGDYVTQNDDDPFNDEDCDGGPGDTSLCDYADGDRSGQGCSVASCGDGYKNLAAGEQCDDGNVATGDGCDDNCQIEYTCGDGNVGGPEQCDDRNTDSGDGCDASCAFEACTGCSLAGADPVKCAQIPQCSFDDGSTLLKFITFGFAGNPSCEPATSCQTNPVGVCCPDPRDTDPANACGAPVPRSQCDETNPFLTPTWKASPPNTCADCPSQGASSASSASSSVASTGTCCYMKRNSGTGKYEQKTEAVPSSTLEAPSWCASIYKGVFNPDPVPDPLKCPTEIDLKITKTGPGKELVEPGDTLEYTITVSLESGELPADVSAKVLDSIPFGLEPIGLPTQEQSEGCSWPGGTVVSFITCYVKGGMGSFNVSFRVKSDGCPNTGMSPNSAIVYAPQGYYDGNTSNDSGFASGTKLVCPTGQGVCCEYGYGQTVAQCKYPVTGSQCIGTNREFKAGETDCAKTNVCPPRPVGTCCNAASSPISCTKKLTQDRCTGSTEEWVEDAANDHATKACADICDDAYSLTTCCFADPAQCRENITVSSCEALGGNPQGMNVSGCAQCKPVGACCSVSPTYSCTENKQASECSTGTFLPGKSCLHCQYDVGVCCGAKGQTKENVSQAACTALAAFAPAQWYANKDASACPATGACCDPTSATGCSELTYNACYTIPNASFQGVGKKCTDPGLSCVKMGACCEAGKTCKQSTQGQCPSPAVWSEGKTCQEACPSGTCCHLKKDGTPTHSCDVNSLECDKLSGYFNAGGACGSSACQRFFCYQGGHEPAPSCHSLDWAPGMNPPVEGAIPYGDKPSCQAGQCNPNAPKGACCPSSGPCRDNVTSDACSGDWKEGRSCSEQNLCANGKAACCTSSGSCSLKTAEECTGSSKYHPETLQCPSPAYAVCGQVVCCAPQGVPGLTSMCLLANPTQCRNMRGTVKTGLSTISCEGNPCNLGACCSPDGNQCVLSTSSACSTASGKAYHEGKTCNNVDCTKPVQECCVPDASGVAAQCVPKLTSTQCIGGTSYSPGSNCSGVCQDVKCCTKDASPVCKKVSDVGGVANCKDSKLYTGNCGVACAPPTLYCCTGGKCLPTSTGSCSDGGTPTDEATCKEKPACKAPEKKYCCNETTKKCDEATGATCPGGGTPTDQSSCDKACATTTKYCCTPSNSSMDAPPKCVEKTPDVTCAGGTYVNDSCGGTCKSDPKRNWCCTNVNTNTCGPKTEGVNCTQKSPAGYYTQEFCISQCEDGAPTCAAAGESCNAAKPCCDTSGYQCSGGTCKPKTVACCATSDKTCAIRSGTTCPSGETPLAGNPASCPAASTKPCGEPPVTERKKACCDGQICTEKTPTECNKAGFKPRNESACTPDLCTQPEKKYCCNAATKKCGEITGDTCPGGGKPMDESTCQKQPACAAPQTGACCVPQLLDATKRSCDAAISKGSCGTYDGAVWMDDCAKTCTSSVSVCDESKGCYAMNADGTCPVDPGEFVVAPRSWWMRLTGWLTGSRIKAVLVPSTGGCCCPQTGGSSSKGGASSIPPVASSSTPPIPPNPASSSKPSTPLTCDKCAGVKVLSSCTSPCTWKSGWLWGGSCQKGPSCGGTTGGTNGGTGQSSPPAVSSPRPPTSSSPAPASSPRPVASSVPAVSSPRPTSSNPTSPGPSSSAQPSSHSSSSSSKRRKVSIGFSYIVACEFGFIRDETGKCVPLATCPANASRPEIINYCINTECKNSANPAACEAGCVCGCAADTGTDTTKREAAARCVRDCQARGNAICGQVPSANCCRGACIGMACGN